MSRPKARFKIGQVVRVLTKDWPDCYRVVFRAFWQRQPYHYGHYVYDLNVGRAAEAELAPLNKKEIGSEC